ncbi:MAG: hypothetical protein J2P57_11485 [Acidimicrobiaceae bacterium]|nr:hypothetical protein [Acidimicrobiaceae bacterium]
MPCNPLPRWRRLSRSLVALGALLASFIVAVPSARASGPSSITWSTLNTPTSPPGLSGAAAAYDADLGMLVLFGGVTASGALSGTTWLWNGTSWRAAPPSVGQPAPRQLASMAFDPAQHQLILFGGLGANGFPLNDTWAWNGASWYELNSGGSGGPSPRAGAALGYDTSRDLVLFGGMGAPTTSSAVRPADPGALPAPSPTSTTTGSTTTVAPTSLVPTTTPTAPPATTQPPTPVVGSGTTTLADTWLWDGRAWTQEHPAVSPPARAGAAVASNTGGHELTLFGGSATPFIGPGASPSPLSDTWEWVDGGWAHRSPRSSPPPRYDSVFGYDTDTGGSVLFGGSGTSGALGDTWSWNGTTWSPVAVASAPARRAGAAGQFDAASRQLVLFGGADASGQVLADTDVLTTPPVSLGPPAGTVTPSGPTSSSPNAPGAVVRPKTTTTGPGATPAPTSTGPGTTRATSTTAGSPSSRSVHPGDVVILGGSGFRPGARIVITFHSSPVVVGSATVAANGTFSATVSVPTGASPGAHAFEATGPNIHGQTTSLWTPVQVLALTASGRTSLTVKLSMLGIAIAIPVISWLVLSARSSFRRSRTARG